MVSIRDHVVHGFLVNGIQMPGDPRSTKLEPQVEYGDDRGYLAPFSGFRAEEFVPVSSADCLAPN